MRDVVLYSWWVGASCNEWAAGAPIGFDETNGATVASDPMSVKTWINSTIKTCQILIRIVYLFKLTSTYETGKIPFRLAIRPSNQLSSTRLVRLTNSPLFSDSSMADWAWTLNLARAWPSGVFFDCKRTPSLEMIYFEIKQCFIIITVSIMLWWRICVIILIYF